MATVGESQVTAVSAGLGTHERFVDSKSEVSSHGIFDNDEPTEEERRVRLVSSSTLTTHLYERSSAVWFGVST